MLICLLFVSLISYSQTDDFKRHLVRAETAFKMGKFQEAVVEYEEAIKLDSRNGNLYYNLASVQEKMETIEAYKAAIDNYKKYLELSPESNDKDVVINKIYAIEFKMEDKVRITKHLQNLNGTWRSDMFVKKTGLPLWFFEINLVNDELRITVSPKGALYKNNFTYQTVTIPFDEKSVAFAFTNDKVTAAQTNDAEHTMVDLLSSQSSNISMLSPLLHGVLNATSTAGYETLSSYIFKLKIESDSIVGTMQVIDKKVDAKSSKIIGDEIQQISFNKSGENYPIPELTPAEKEEQKLDSYYLQDKMGLRLGYLMAGSNSQMGRFGLTSGIAFDFLSTLMHFSQKRSFAKIGLYVSDDADVIIGKKDPANPEKKADILTSICFNLGPAVSFYPARKTNFSFYYVIRPSVLFDFTEQLIPGMVRFVFMYGPGVSFRYGKLWLGAQSNLGRTKYIIDDSTNGRLDLKYTTLTIGLTF